MQMSSSWHVEEVAARQAAVDEVKAAISTSEEAAGKELSTQGQSRPLDTTTWRSGFWWFVRVLRFGPIRVAAVRLHRAERN